MFSSPSGEGEEEGDNAVSSNSSVDSLNQSLNSSSAKGSAPSNGASSGKVARKAEIPLESGGGSAKAVKLGSTPVDTLHNSKSFKTLVWSLIALLSTAFVLCNLDKVNMSVAVIPLAEQFGWSATDKGLVSSSFFWGYALTQIPAGFVASRLGGGAVLVLAVMTWSLGTAIAPLVAGLGIVPLSISRLVVGLGEGFAPSAVTDLLATYVPKRLRARAVTTVFGGMEVGNALGLLLCGPLIESSGWASVFYGFAALGFVWCAIWPFFSPHKQLANVDPQIVAEIQEKKKSKRTSKIPYREFMKSSAVWAVVTAHFCHNWGYYTLLAWLPSYFESVLKLNLTGAARVSLVPYLAMAFMIPIVGSVADGLQKRYSTTNTRKIAQGVAFLGPAACMLLCSFLSPLAISHKTLLIVTLSLAFALSTFSRGGLYCNHQDLSPKYAAALLGISNTAGALPGIFGVWLTGKLFDITGGNWGISLFVPIAIAQAIGFIVFSIYGSGEQIWD
jgi:ACS family sodium-dependent inorganic phosphate cotransporter